MFLKQLSNKIIDAFCWFQIQIFIKKKLTSLLGGQIARGLYNIKDIKIHLEILDITHKYTYIVHI